jgi:hypothetical protein
MDQSRRLLPCLVLLSAGMLAAILLSAFAPAHGVLSQLQGGHRRVFVQPLPLKMKLAERLPSIPLPFGGRFVTRTFADRHNDGPHALAHLAFAVKRVLGGDKAYITDAVPPWDEAGFTKGLPVGGTSSPGDILVQHEWHDKGPGTGVKQFIFELGDMAPQAMHRASSKYIGHSFYTRDFLRLPHRAMVRSYVDAKEWPNVPATAAAIRKEKEPLILVDVEMGEVPGYLNGLKQRHPGLKVVVLENDNFNHHGTYVDLLRRAKVYVDGGMRGMERKAQEALLYYVVPVLERSRNGENELDYPIPDALNYALKPNEKGAQLSGGIGERGVDLFAKVDAALHDWEGTIMRAAAARALVLAQPTLNLVDTARLLRLTLHVHVLATGAGTAADTGKRSQAALLSAASLHFIAPAASATLHTSSADASAFEGDVRGALLSAGDALGALSFVDYKHGSMAGGKLDRSQLAAASRFGNADVAVVLSWRALPLRPGALEAWQENVRAGKAAVSILYVNGGALGIMYRVSSSAALSVSLTPDGLMQVTGEAAKSAGSWDPAAERGVEWLDLRRLYRTGVPAGPHADRDEAALDGVLALTEAGIDVTDPSLELHEHKLALHAASRPEAPSTAYVCSHVDYKRIVTQTLYSMLCVYAPP